MNEIRKVNVDTIRSEIATNIMILLQFLLYAILSHFVESDIIDFSDFPLGENEDITVLQDSIKQYGPPQSLNYKGTNLPGPEIIIDGDKNVLRLPNNLDTVNLDYDYASENYTVRLRRLKKHFGFNDRYEVGKIETVNATKIQMLKGQYSQIFPRKSGGFYIRTLGYIVDENGLHEFLLDLSKVTTTQIKKTKNLELEAGEKS